MARPAGVKSARRTSFSGHYSYNGGATTTILFPRLVIGTGSDATGIPSTVHGSLGCTKASVLKRLVTNSPNAWGKTAIFLQTASNPGAAAVISAIMHTATLAVGGTTLEFARDAGVPATKVWQVDASGGPSYVDETTDAGSFALGDLTLFPATEEDEADYVAVGRATKFGSMSWSSRGGTAGTVGTVAWEYYNGSTWAALTGVVDGTTGFTAALSHGQVVSWTIPEDWATLEINGSGGQLYYIRARVTTVYTVNPVYSHCFIHGPHTIPAGHIFALGFLPDGTAHGDARGTYECENIAWGP